MSAVATVARGAAIAAGAVALAVAVAVALSFAATLPFAAVASAGDMPGQALPAGPFLARVSSVYDGDTLVAATEGREVTVRIAGIDAPESEQPGGRDARTHLAAMVCGRDIRVNAYKVDPFGRLVATVEVGSADVGLALLDAGHAWHFTRYAREQPPAQRAAYVRAEARARARNAGLWKLGEPEAPWAYRERKRGARAPASVQRAARERVAC